jgi:putative heme-binding domain-containing protein
MNGDGISGKGLFAAHCATCHRVKGAGQDVGPDLTLIQKKFDREGLLDAIVNPGAAIVFGYEPWLINTKSGESYFGFVVAESEKTLVIKDLTGKKITVPAASVSLKKKQAGSLMPEPSGLGLSEQDLADIVEYLIHLR